MAGRVFERVPAADLERDRKLWLGVCRGFREPAESGAGERVAARRHSELCPIHLGLTLGALSRCAARASSLEPLIGPGCRPIKRRQAEERSELCGFSGREDELEPRRRRTLAWAGLVPRLAVLPPSPPPPPPCSRHSRRPFRARRPFSARQMK